MRLAYYNEPSQNNCNKPQQVKGQNDFNDVVCSNYLVMMDVFYDLLLMQE